MEMDIERRDGVFPSTGSASRLIVSEEPANKFGHGAFACRDREWLDDSMGVAEVKGLEPKTVDWPLPRHAFGVTDPGGNRIEVSAELEVIYERLVKEWPHEERTVDLWGKGILHN